MYKNNSNRKYFLYDCIKEDYIATYDSHTAMIDLIAYWFNNIDLYGNIHNYVLDEYNCTMCDTIVYPDICGGQVLRRYIVFDDLYRIIDIRQYEKEILSFNPNERYSKKNQKKYVAQYRKEPIRNTGKRKWRGYYRHPKTLAELRDMSNPENKDFIRKKRKLIPTAYDDIVRCYQRSWKSQGKKRKQWQR